MHLLSETVTVFVSSANLVLLNEGTVEGASDE